MKAEEILQWGDVGDYYRIEVDYGDDDFVELKQCKSLTSAKRWVTMNLLWGNEIAPTTYKPVQVLNATYMQIYMCANLST